MNHANGMADSCVQYYDFKPPKDWLHNLFFIYLVEENILPHSGCGINIKLGINNRDLIWAEQEQDASRLLYVVASINKKECIHT